MEKHLAFQTADLMLEISEQELWLTILTPVCLTTGRTYLEVNKAAWSRNISITNGF